MDLKPGTLVVFEGLDATGKSTQMELVNEHFPDGIFTHQPSGSTQVGEVIYQMTEKIDNMNPLTRQLLHLASHAEHYDKQIIPALTDRGVFMDRCWWSTIAYGYYGGGIKWLMDIEDFMKMVLMPTQGIMPTIVFYFQHPFKKDKHNTPNVMEGYYLISNRYFPRTVAVPRLSKKETTRFIIGTLKERGLVAARNV